MRVDSGLHSMAYMEDDGGGVLCGSEGEEEDDGDFHLVQVGEGHGGLIGSKAELRKSNKPIMEKRRRARINNCLNELKAILLEAMRKDPARHSKLEKADILELTVRHLQNVQRNQLAIAMATDPTVLHRFKNGFSECATEVSRYLGRLDGVEHGIKQRLTGHLGSCVNGLQQVGPMAFGPGQSTRYSPLTMPFSIPPSPITPVSDLISPAGSAGQDLNNNRPPQNPSMTTPPSSTVTSSGSKKFELYPSTNFNQRLNAAAAAASAFLPTRGGGNGGSARPTPPPSPPSQIPHHHHTVIKVPAIKLVDNNNVDLTIIEDTNLKINFTMGTPTTPLDFSVTRSPALNLNSLRSGGGGGGHLPVRVGKVGPVQKIEADSSSSSHSPNSGRDSSMWRPW